MKYDAVNQLRKVSEASFHYALKEILSRINLDCSNLSFRYGSYSFGASQPLYTVVIKQFSEQEWEELLESSPVNVVRYCKEYQSPLGPVPMLGNRDELFLLKEDDSVTIQTDIIRWTLFGLWGLGDNWVADPDAFGRALGKNSFLYLAGLMERPYIDEWAKVLEYHLITDISTLPYKEKRQFEFVNTHDVDNLFIFRGKGLRYFLAVLKSKLLEYKIRDTFLLVWSYLLEWFQANKSPVSQDLYYLAKPWLENNIRSVFFFMNTKQTEYDSGYSLDEPTFKSFYQRVVQGGHGLGIHPSFYSSEDPNVLAQEIRGLAEATNTQVILSRQHFLRFQSDTMGALEGLGIKEDYTDGYPDVMGFRSGTCSPFVYWDQAKEKTVSLKRYPLTVMECTGRYYLNLSADETFSVARELFQKTRTLGGSFVFLWHPGFGFMQDKSWTMCYRSFLKWCREHV